MDAVSTNQIADILHFNNNKKYLKRNNLTHVFNKASVSGMIHSLKLKR